MELTDGAEEDDSKTVRCRQCNRMDGSGLRNLGIAIPHGRRNFGKLRTVFKSKDAFGIGTAVKWRFIGQFSAVCRI